MIKRIHNVCPDCGSILDSGERCDCGGMGTRVQVSIQVRPAMAAKPANRPRSRKKKWKPKPGTEAYRIHQRGL